MSALRKKLPASLALLMIASLTFADGNQPEGYRESYKVMESLFRPEIGTKGMVVSDSQVASEWGAEVLRKGGNAIDAAVATAFALAVTRPQSGSIGGGGFLVFCPKPGKHGPRPCQTIDYREKAPAAATKDMYLKDGKFDSKLSLHGALASGVPGVVAGLLMALERFGTFTPKQVLSRPIQLARKGVRFGAYMEDAAIDRWGDMNEEAKRVLSCTPNKKKAKIETLQPCQPGEKFQQPDLARVLREISNKGKNGFYHGWVAKKIVDGLKKEGGILTLKDLADYQPKLRTPVVKNFKGFEVVSMPPPSSGGVILLQLLDYAERADQAGAFKDGLGSASMIHAILHGMSLAFADRTKHFGDSDFYRVPIQGLLDSNYLKKRWESTYNASKKAIPEGPGNPPADDRHETTHFSVVDRHGNSVSITTTINYSYGSGFVPPGTGIMMNDEMDDFSAQPGVPNVFGLVGAEANSIAPHKRPLSSMSPTIVRDLKGNTRFVVGAAGGPRIITSTFLSLLYRLRFGLSFPDAVHAARFHHQWKPDWVFVENHGISPEVISRLTEMGYTVKTKIPLGRIHAIERYPNGRVWGVPDRRAEGSAEAE